MVFARVAALFVLVGRDGQRLEAHLGRWSFALRNALELRGRGIGTAGFHVGHGQLLRDVRLLRALRIVAPEGFQHVDGARPVLEP